MPANIITKLQILTLKFESKHSKYFGKNFCFGPDFKFSGFTFSFKNTGTVKPFKTLAKDPRHKSNKRLSGHFDNISMCSPKYNTMKYWQRTRRSKNSQVIQVSRYNFATKTSKVTPNFTLLKLYKHKICSTLEYFQNDNILK